MGFKPRRWSVFLLVQLLLAILILEGGLRLARPHHEGLRVLLYSPSLETEFDRVESTEELVAGTVLGYRPHQVWHGFVLNSRGFRTPEYRFERAPGRSRIVVLGDSFTFASTRTLWSDMWPTRMEQRLDELIEPPAEVINLAMPAVGPRFELRLWELAGAPLRPDLVVLAFFIGNDFSDESGTPLTPTRDEALARWSVTWRLGRNLMRLWRERRPAAAWPEASGSGDGGRGGFELPEATAAGDSDEPLFTEKTYLGFEWARLRLCRRSLREEFEGHFAQTAPVLIRLHRSVRRQGADLAVMMIPDEVQVDDELRARVLDRFSIPASDIDLDYPQRRLAELLAAEGVPVLDLLPELRRRSRKERLYRTRDTHWNARGNRVAGDLAADFLAAAGLPRGSRVKKIPPG